MKRILTLLIVLSLGLGLVACGSSADKIKTQQTAAPEASAQATDGPKDSQELSVDNPIVVDKENKEVRILAAVNGDFFEKSTMHGVVYVDGAQGENCMFQSFAKQDAFYDGLKAIGLAAADNINSDNAGETYTDGPALEVTFAWDDKTASLDEMIVESNSKPVDIRFTGNKAASDKYQSGCITCLTTCFVGITSNANYYLGEEPNNVTFKLNPDVAPKDQTTVTIIYRAKAK